MRAVRRERLVVGLARLREGGTLCLAAFLLFALFSPGYEAGETSKTIKGAAYFLHYGRFADDETERRAQAGEFTIGPGRTSYFRFGGPVLFFQFVGGLQVLESLMRRLSPYPEGSPEFWYAVGFGLSFLPAAWSVLTVLGLWLALGALGVSPRHRLVACALIALTSHQLPLTKTAYDGLFLGMVAIFAIWCTVLGTQRMEGGSLRVAFLVALLAALGVATKESGIILGFPLGMLFLTGGASARVKMLSIVFLIGGLLVGLGARAGWNVVVMGSDWSFIPYVGGATTVANWKGASYSLKRLAIYLFSPTLSVFIHSPTLLLLFVFARRLYHLQPVVFIVSVGTLLLSVAIHSANLWEFLAAENYSGRFNVWVLPVAYLAAGYLPRALGETGRGGRTVAIAIVALGLTVSVASALGNWPYRATWLSRQYLGTNMAPVEPDRFDEVALARAWEPRFSLPIDAVTNLARNVARMTGQQPPDLVNGASPINQRISNGLATWWFALIAMGFNRSAILLFVGALAASVVLLSRGLWLWAAPSIRGEKTGRDSSSAARQEARCG